MFSDNVQHLIRLERLESELDREQKKNLFFTQHVLDPKPRQPMSIQEHINFNKMNKVQTVKPKSIREHINMSTYFIRSTQFVPGTTSSIQEHIQIYQVNKIQTIRSKEKIDNHFDMPTHSIEMPFESTPLFHLNRIEELEYKKPVKESIYVHKVCILDNYPQFLERVIRDCLATCAHYVVQVKSYCEDKGDDDEFLLQQKYEDEFSKLLEKTSIEQKKNSSDQVEKLEHNCENTCMDDEPLFLDKLFKDECDHSGEKTRIEDFKSRVPSEKRKLDLSIFTLEEPTNDQ